MDTFPCVRESARVQRRRRGKAVALPTSRWSRARRASGSLLVLALLPQPARAETAQLSLHHHTAPQPTRAPSPAAAPAHTPRLSSSPPPRTSPSSPPSTAPRQHSSSMSDADSALKIAAAFLLQSPPGERASRSPPLLLLLLLLLSCRRLSRTQSPTHSLTLTPYLPARSRRRLRRPHRARRAPPPLGRGAARGRAAPCARPVRARAAHRRRPRGRGRQGQDAPDRGEQGRGRRREARRAWGGELVRVGRGQGGASVLLSAAHARPRSAVRVEGVELTVVGSH